MTLRQRTVRQADSGWAGPSGLSRRLVAAQPPAAAPHVLALLVAGIALAGRVPDLIPVAVAVGTLVIVLAALWARGVAPYFWAAGGVLLLLPLPLHPAGAGVTAAGMGLALAATWLVRALASLVGAAQASAVQRYGERQDLERRSRAQHDELAGQVQYWASHDRLTEVLNRSALTAHLAELAAERSPAGVLVLSLAGFTGINEAVGPDAADLLLAGMARRLRGRARATDLVARLGGDEFAVVLPGLTGEHAELVAGRLLQVLDDPFAVEDRLIPVHARCGLALDDGGYAAGATDLLRRAMSAAKAAPVGGPLAIFNDETATDVQAALDLEADLHLALERDEFFLLYQPLICADSGQIVSLEALVRWRRDGGTVPPDVFIPVAEGTGQIVGIGRRVLELAVAQLRQWNSGPASSLTVAVNVSARELAEPGFVAQVQSIVWGAGIDPHRLVLELTESLLVADSDSAIAALWQLRGLGFKIALDDFGTGYSSLARLGELPLDEMKIDKSFVDRLGVTTNDSTVLVSAAIAMGHGLQLSVVAEGVETDLQAAHLKHLGCDLLQGYLLGRPQTAADLTPQFGTRLLRAATTIPGPRTAAAETDLVVPRLLPDPIR